MEKYKVRFKRSAARELEALDSKKDRDRIIRSIQALANDPRPPGCEKLSGKYDLFRVRVGDYRIVYSVNDKEIVVFVVKIGDRKNIYHGLA